MDRRQKRRGGQGDIGYYVENRGDGWREDEVGGGEKKISRGGRRRSRTYF